MPPAASALVWPATGLSRSHAASPSWSTRRTRRRPRRTARPYVDRPAPVEPAGRDRLAGSSRSPDGGRRPAQTRKSGSDVATAAQHGKTTLETPGPCRTILVDGSATRGFTAPTWRHADDYQPVTSEKPCLSTHPNEDENGSSSTIRTDGRGQISRPALQPESRQLPLRPRRTRRRLPADEA
jgi:hypothetical protein